MTTRRPPAPRFPAILGRLFAIACAIVGDKSVRGAGIGVEFGGLAVGLERGLHLMDLIDGDAGIGLAIELEHRLLNLRCQFDRALRRRVALVGERAIERDAGFQIWIMRGVMPNIAAAAAEAHDAEPVGVAALRFGHPDQRTIRRRSCCSPEASVAGCRRP